MLRLFAALPLPPHIGQALARRQTGIDGARWVPAANLHITLRFFGEVREDVARDLDTELSQIKAGPLEILMEGVGSFGEGDDIQVVWAGVADSPALWRLASSCESAARRVGLRAETRKFKPHVTLAYTRRPHPAEVAAWIQSNNLLKSPPIAIPSFALFSSTLGGEGAHYRIEAEYPL